MPDISKLPVWAREYIATLIKQAEPNGYEITALRKAKELAESRARLYQNRCDAMLDIMQDASRGGSETATEFVIRVASMYEPAETEE